MAGQRRLRLLGLVAARGAGAQPHGLCEVCVEATGTSGAGIMLMASDLPAGSVCTTDQPSALIEDLQFSLGEGPGLDAHRLDRAVLEPHLEDMDQARWIGFAAPVLEAGVRAVFAFPLHVGEARLGVLTLHRSRPGGLSDDEHADALVMTDIAARSVLDLQAGAVAGRLATELEEASDLQYPVHQATGMVAAQLEIDIGAALVRLRAHAFGSGRRLRAVSDDVVARKLRFDGESR